MKYSTHNTNGRINVNGISCKGEINCTYDALILAFGEPGNGDGYKVDAEWWIEKDGVVATVYNYKDGKNYKGDSGTPVELITEWYIGGFNSDAVKLVKSIIGA